MHGANGQGKTSMLEAIAWIARAHSFRGVTDALLVRNGCDAGDRARRDRRPTIGTQLFEAEIRATGRNRVLCNTPAGHARARSARTAARHGVRARRPRAGEGRARRTPRRTSTSSSAMLAARYDAARADFERVLKQRNALLALGRARRRRRVATLDVFDEQLVHAGARARARPAAARRAAGPGGRTRRTRRSPTTAGRSPRPTKPSGRRSRSAIADADAVDELLRAALARAPAGRDRPGRHARRPAPRRLAADDRRARRAHAGVAGRATQRSRSRCGSPATASCTSSPGTPPVLLLDDVFSELDAQPRRARSCATCRPARRC